MYTDWWMAPRQITNDESDMAEYAEEHPNVIIFFASLQMPEEI